MLDSRKRLLGGAVIAVAGLGTALLFRKPPTEPPAVNWPSGFTEVQPSAPLVNPTPPEPVQPRLAGRIESLADASVNPAPATPATGSIYQLPNSANSASTSDQRSPGNTPSDPFLRSAGSATLPASGESQTSETAAKFYALAELKPLVPTESSASSAPAEHTTGYRWSPNRSPVVDPPASTALAVNTALAERPSLLAPPPMNAPMNTPMNALSGSSPLAASPATATPSLSLPTYSFAPAAPLLTPGSLNPPLPAASSGVRHRIADGDTLGSIARRYYGDEQRARQVFESNRSVLRDPEILPIGYELTIPGGAPNSGLANPPATSPSATQPYASPMSQAAPLSQGVPPLLTPPALEQFAPRTLAVSTSSWQNPNARATTEPAAALAPPAAPLAPVALSPWDQQLAAAAPLYQATPTTMPVAPALASPPAAPTGWPPASPGANPLATPATPHVGWPPRPAEVPASWPTRAWNSSENALNWVGDKVLGTGVATAPSTGTKTYLVKPLETWETLAQRFYGDVRHVTTLQAANQQVPATGKIRPGTLINVPPMPL